jgi:hypothetical protein
MKTQTKKDIEMIKKTIIIVLFFCTKIFAQKEINNIITEKHIFVKGTKLALVPPSGFKDATGFAGFQEAETNSSIMVTELPAPFDELTKAFTKENLLSRGMELKEIIDLNFQQNKAKLYKLNQKVLDDEYSKIMLVFGDEKSVVMVNFIYPSVKPELEESMSIALNSAVYEIDKVVDPLGSAPFKIDLGTSGLKFAASMSGSFIFTSDGFVPVKSADKAFFSIGQSISKMEIPNKKEFAIERLQYQPGGDKIKVDQTNEIEIDGMKGYEIIGFGEDEKGKKELNYQVVIFGEKTYYFTLGLATNDFDKYLGQFKEITKTFKLK